MKQVTPAGYKKAGIAFIIIAVIFTVLLLTRISTWETFCSEPVTVQATVLRNVEYYGKRSTTYVPYVSYEYNNTKVSDVAIKSDSPRHSPAKIGSQVPVRIDGNDPRKMLNKPGVMDFVFVAIVFFFAVFGILMLRASKKADIY